MTEWSALRPGNFTPRETVPRIQKGSANPRAGRDVLENTDEWARTPNDPVHSQITVLDTPSREC